MENIFIQLAAAASILTGNTQHYEPPHASKVAFQYTYQKEQERLRSESEKAKLKPATLVSSSPAAAPQRAVSGSVQASGDGVWDRLAQCEAGGRWNASTGNGYYGGLQFNLSTYHSNGGTGNPANASREEQIRVAKNLHAKRGFSPWPGCKRKLGL